MSFIRKHEFSRVEYDWLGVDKNGYIGFFSSAGFGPIPETVIKPNLSIDLTQEILGLPKCSETESIQLQDRKISEWIEIAERGLFSFDWSFNSDSYEMVSWPETPVFFKEFLKRTDNLIAFIHLPNLDFISSKILKI